MSKRVTKGRFKIGNSRLVMAYKGRAKIDDKSIVMTIFLRKPKEGKIVEVIDWFNRNNMFTVKSRWSSIYSRV